MRSSICRKYGRRRLHYTLCLAWKWEVGVCGSFQGTTLLGQSSKYRIHFGSGHINSLFLLQSQKEFCFLGAGALGTTEVLLRSKQHGLHMSPLVGRNLSGNGDFLIFGTYFPRISVRAHLIYRFKVTTDMLISTGSPVNPRVLPLEQQSLLLLITESLILWTILFLDMLSKMVAFLRCSTR